MTTYRDINGKRYEKNGNGEWIPAVPTPFDFSPKTYEQADGTEKLASSGKGGGGKGASSSPSGADQQTQANRVNQNTPYASTGWTHNQDGTWTQSTALNPQLQGISNNLQGQVANAWSKPFDNGSAARNQAINAAYGQSVSRLDPQWDHRQEMQGAQLANQGLGMDSEAYRNATAQFGRDRNDAYSSAMNNAIGMGNQAQATTFAQNLAARNAPMEALQGLRGFTAMPGYSPAGDYMQQQMLQQQMMADAVKGAGQVGTGIINSFQQGSGGASGYNPYPSYGSGGGYVNPAGYDSAGFGNYPGNQSDARVKQDIHRLPVEAAPGVPFSLFAYKAAPQQKYLGVIAQDLEKVSPGDVRTGPDGIKRVSAPFKPFALR
jgi:hypothetical protein